MIRKASPVPVTGMGCVCAAGTTLPECLETLFSGGIAPAPPRRFASEHAVAHPVFEVPERFYDRYPRRPEWFDTTLLGLAAAEEAILNAGWSAKELRGKRVGVCVGTSVGAALNFLEFFRDHRRGIDPDLRHIRRFLDSNPALALARHFGWSGPAQTVVNACSSGADAIGVAAGWIRQGLCDVALAGGADELSPITYNGFIRLMITSPEHCRPFTPGRKGLNLGEGAAMLLLEAEPGRRKREGAAVLGYGTCADAHHLTAPEPDGAGLRRAIADGLAQAGLDAGDVAFVNVHGTGTPNNDLAEAGVLRDLFPETAVSATKGWTGHTLGAAGAIEAVLTASFLLRGELPSSLGCAAPDPELGVAPVVARASVRGAAALSQSLAFGGNNSVLVLGAGNAGGGHAG